MYSERIVERKASEEYTKELIKSNKKHFEKYGYEKISEKEFNDLFELI
jgi:hypothetical protein